MSNQGGWRRKDIYIPAAALDYNKHMGGVELSDVLIGFYSEDIRPILPQHYLDISVVNPFLLHKKLLKSKQQKLPKSIS